MEFGDELYGLSRIYGHLRAMSCMLTGHVRITEDVYWAIQCVLGPDGRCGEWYFSLCE